MSGGNEASGRHLFRNPGTAHYDQRPNSGGQPYTSAQYGQQQPAVMMGMGRGAMPSYQSPGMHSYSGNGRQRETGMHPHSGNGRQRDPRDRSHSGDRRHQSRSAERMNANSSFDNSFSPQNYRGKQDEITFLSRTLLSILRHNAGNFGLNLMPGGFIYVDEILHKVRKLYGYTLEDVRYVVESNDKQYFTLAADNERMKIRANQGHTMEVEDLDLQPITSADDYPTVIHGTYMEAWEKIKKTGLNRMKRNHIHFAPGTPGANGVISGMRPSCEVMIYLDLEKALKDGLKFFVSSNNVILSPGDANGVIHPRYFFGAKDRYLGSRLPFDPKIDTKPVKQNKGKGQSNTRKRKEEQKDKRSKEDNEPDKVKPADAKPPTKADAKEQIPSTSHSEVQDKSVDKDDSGDSGPSGSVEVDIKKPLVEEVGSKRPKLEGKKPSEDETCRSEAFEEYYALLCGPKKVEDLDLQPITSADDYPIVIHGTYMEAWEKIKKTGLNRMKRNHIHFAPGANSFISGMRSSCEVMIYLDLEKALKDGLKFFVSSNNVILSPGDANGVIHPRYFFGAKDRFYGSRLPFDPEIDTKPVKQADAREQTHSTSHGQVQGAMVSRVITVSLVCGNNVVDTINTMDEAGSKRPKLEEKKTSESIEDDYSEDSEEDEEEVDMEPVMIDDPEISKVTVNELIDSKPPFVVVIHFGENLGEENGCLHRIAVGTRKELYVFNLEKNMMNDGQKNMMNDGQLKDLLMNKEITKVFCGIQAISSSLIMEYDIVMNGIPIWDIEILHDKLSGQMSEMDKDTIKEMGFHEKYFKKWVKKSEQPGTLSEEDMEELKHQAALMMKMFPIFQKQMSDSITKVMKKNTYERAIPMHRDFLCEKIQKLKLKMKEKEKKGKAETKKEEQASSKGKGAAKATGVKSRPEQNRPYPLLHPERGGTSAEALINEQTAVMRQLIASVNSLTNAVQVLTSAMEKDPLNFYQ